MKRLNKFYEAAAILRKTGLTTKAKWDNAARVLGGAK